LRKVEKGRKVSLSFLSLSLSLSPSLSLSLLLSVSLSLFSVSMGVRAHRRIRHRGRRKRLGRQGRPRESQRLKREGVVLGACFITVNGGEVMTEIDAEEQH
jgi:hypothetical protein